MKQGLALQIELYPSPQGHTLQGRTFIGWGIIRDGWFNWHFEVTEPSLGKNIVISKSKRFWSKKRAKREAERYVDLQEKAFIDQLNRMKLTVTQNPSK